MADDIQMFGWFDPFMAEMFANEIQYMADEIQDMSDAVNYELDNLINTSVENSCSVSWTDSEGNPVGDGMDLSGLPAGSYTASMLHSNGCIDEQTIEVGFVCMGCMDDTACNYNADATDDDESCVFEEENFDCD